MSNRSVVTVYPVSPVFLVFAVSPVFLVDTVFPVIAVFLVIYSVSSVSSILCEIQFFQ